MPKKHNIAKRGKPTALFTGGMSTAFSFALSPIHKATSSFAAGAAYVSASIYSIFKNTEVEDKIQHDISVRRRIANLYNIYHTHAKLTQLLTDTEKTYNQACSTSLQYDEWTRDIEFNSVLTTEIPPTANQALRDLMTDLWSAEYADELLALLDEDKNTSKTAFWSNLKNAATQVFFTLVSMGIYTLTEEKQEDAPYDWSNVLNLIGIPICLLIQYVAHIKFARELGKIRDNNRPLENSWHELLKLQDYNGILANKLELDAQLGHEALAKYNELERNLKTLIGLINSKIFESKSQSDQNNEPTEKLEEIHQQFEFIIGEIYLRKQEIEQFITTTTDSAENLQTAL